MGDFFLNRTITMGLVSQNSKNIPIFTDFSEKIACKLIKASLFCCQMKSTPFNC